MMQAQTDLKSIAAVDVQRPDDSPIASVDVYVDPVLEKAALRKYCKLSCSCSYLLRIVAT